MKNVLLFTFAIFSLNEASAATVKEKAKVFKFNNTNCKTTGTCDLKSFELKVNRYKVFLKPTDNANWTYRGTGMVASYETDSSESLEKYGIGQFIQGCQYVSVQEENGVVNYPTILRDFMGKRIRYFHPKMVVDGFIPDPLSWGDDKDVERHSGYFVKDMSDIDYTVEDYYNGTNASLNKLFVMDHPGVASYSPDTKRAYNISLKFKTCVYKAAEVPKDNEYTNTNFASPLHCFEWVSSFVFNHKKLVFESTPDVNPYCFQKLEDREE